MRITVDSCFMVEIDDFIVREGVENVLVLPDPPWTHVSYEELDFPLENMGSEGKWNENVGEVMEEITHEAANGENHRGNGVIYCAIRRLPTAVI